MFAAKVGFPSTLTTNPFTKHGGTILLLTSPGKDATGFIGRCIGRRNGISGTCVINNRGTISHGATGNLTSTLSVLQPWNKGYDGIGEN